MYNIKTFYIYLCVIFCFVKLIFFLVNDNVDCCITDYVKRKKCHLNRTVDGYHQGVGDHAQVGRPAHTGEDGHDQGRAGDRDGRAAHGRADGKEGDCDQVCRCHVNSRTLVAINVTANICITVVPFMLMVIPVGRTKLVISWEHPSSSRHVLVFSGKACCGRVCGESEYTNFCDLLKEFHRA